MVPVFNNVGKKFTAKSYHPISLLSEFIGKLVPDSIVNPLEKCIFFLISRLVLGPLDQLQIF